MVMGMGDFTSGENTSMGISNDQFFTPNASEEILAANLGIATSAHLSKESVPSAFSRSISIIEDQVTREFDPLGLIIFDSPQQQQQQHPPSQTNDKVRSPLRGNSLLDLEAPQPVSPLSLPKYSEHDIQILRQQYEQRLERQAEFQQFEIGILQEKYTQSLRAVEDMRLLLAEYEKTVGNLVEWRKLDSNQNFTVEAVEQERQKSLLENQSLKISFSNLKIVYDDTKRTLDSLKLVFKSFINRYFSI